MVAHPCHTLTLTLNKLLPPGRDHRWCCTLHLLLLLPKPDLTRLRLHPQQALPAMGLAARRLLASQPRMATHGQPLCIRCHPRTTDRLRASALAGSLGVVVTMPHHPSLRSRGLCRCNAPLLPRHLHHRCCLRCKVHSEVAGAGAGMGTAGGSAGASCSPTTTRGTIVPAVAAAAAALLVAAAAAHPRAAAIAQRPPFRVK
jgi:hypothetical protein